GVDGRLGPERGILARCESVAREQRAVRISKRIVAEDRSAPPLLQLRPGKQPAVQERNASERLRAVGPIARRGVECPEEEGVEDCSLITSSRCEATGVAVGEETEISVQPTLRLE